MTPQIPLGSAFGPRTTARDVLGDWRLDGLRVVITGGSAGVGLEDRGGVYCEDCDIAIAVPADHPEPRGVRPWHAIRRSRSGCGARARSGPARGSGDDVFTPQPQRWPPSHSAVPTSLTPSPRPLRAFTRRRQANPSPSGRLDFRAKARPPRRSEQGAMFASILYAKCSGLVRPWSGTKNTKLDPTQKFRARSSSCL